MTDSTANVSPRVGRKPVPPEQRFWPKVSKTDSCWLWMGAKIQDGYGSFGFGEKVVSAHRVSWELHNGPIPNGLCVLHKCDVRNCVNPDHLFLGTRDDNMADRNRKGRQARGEKSGRAKLTNAVVIAIRRRYAAGGTSIRKLASEFCISKSQILSVVTFKSWSHVK